MFNFLLSIFISTAAYAHDCGWFLKDANVDALAKQVSLLNPDIRIGDSIETLYLALKIESSFRTELSGELAQHLRRSQARHYNVEGLDSTSLTIFYRNALRALEHRAAALWRKHEIRKLVGVIPHEQAEFAGHLLDSFFSPNNLNDEALIPDEAARYFRERPWQSFDWNSALAQDYSKFDWNDVNRIKLAAVKNKRAGECCHSQAACTLCPHNRALLKP